MGASGVGLLDSDEAGEVIGAATSGVYEDLVELATSPIEEREALIASGCAGVVGRLDPEWLWPGLSRTARVDPSDENRLLRRVLQRYRPTLTRKLPTWEPLMIVLVDEMNHRIKNFESLRKRYNDGEDIDPPWAPLPEDIESRVVKVAFGHPQAVAYAQTVMERTIDETDSEPSLTTLSGLIALAQSLTPWTRVPEHRLRLWKEMIAHARESESKFDCQLARNCSIALKKLRPTVSAA
jgi:hypothetical protein